jgi:cytoskeletal protein CcmA (bactofilin family)
MALKDFMGKTGTTQPAQTAEVKTPAPPPPQPAPRGGAQTTFLDASANFSGTLKCIESLRIDGRVEGEVHCDHTVVVGESGAVQASIEADSVVIVGQVKGDINARSKITLEKTACVIGNLCTPGIVIQEGAKLEGRIMIGSEKGRGAEKSAAPSAEKAADRENEKKAAKASGTAATPSAPAAPSKRPQPAPGAPPPAGG